MNLEQIEAVQTTWRAVLPIADKAADLFYDRLFALDERLRGLFPEDLSEQKKKLMSMIGRVVTALRDVNGIVPAVQELGRRHVGYGVKDEDYATVGAALLWTLEHGLGDAWTPAVEESWIAAYTLLSGVMIDAAKKQLGAYA
jgi:hemoglobin-like flavoprotein